MRRGPAKNASVNDAAAADIAERLQIWRLVRRLCGKSDRCEAQGEAGPTCGLVDTGPLCADHYDRVAPARESASSP